MPPFSVEFCELSQTIWYHEISRAMGSSISNPTIRQNRMLGKDFELNHIASLHLDDDAVRSLSWKDVSIVIKDRRTRVGSSWICLRMRFSSYSSHSILPTFVIVLDVLAFANDVWLCVDGFFRYINHRACLFRQVMITQFKDTTYTCEAVGDFYSCRYSSDLQGEGKERGDGIAGHVQHCNE